MLTAALLLAGIAARASSFSCAPSQVSVLCPQTITAGTTVEWLAPATFEYPVTISTPLAVASGGTGTDDRTLLDSTFVVKLDWETSVLKRQDGAITLDWTNTRLKNSSGVDTIDWGGELLLGSGGTISVDWGGRFLKDAAGITSADWDGRFLRDIAANASVDYATRYLYDNGGIVAVNWQNRLLKDSGGSAFTSIDWNLRQLNDNAGNVIMDWSDPAFGVQVGTLTVLDQLDNGFQMITNSCGAGVSSCSAQCPNKTVLTGGGCSAGVGLSADAPTNPTLWGCTSLTVTTLTAYAFCGRFGL